MKNIILPLAIIASLMPGCSHDHSHDHETVENEPEALAYTLYSDHTELFVEFKPLVTGVESRFAAHFTILGDAFLPLEEANIKLTLTVAGKPVSAEANSPEVPGIFRLRLSPTTAGNGKLVFNIKTKSFEDVITIDSVTVYPDKETALAQQTEESSGGDITYLKEQAWKVEFANTPAQRQPFSEVIKTSGQILSAPGDEMIVTAPASGIVLFAGTNAVTGSPVGAGTKLFVISGGDLAEDNIGAAYKEAKTNLEKTKSDFDRLSLLVADQIVSEKDFQESKQQYENALTAFNLIAKHYSAGGLSITAESSGFVKNILVAEGQFVKAGTPLASISKNKKLILQANVSQKYFGALPSIVTAHFKTADSDPFFSTSDLHGRVLSYGRSAVSGSPFIPITFEFDNPGKIIPGSIVEVYLKTGALANALVIPATSLMEEQGVLYVYVQTAGESFQKREVKTGNSDGIHVQLISGVAEGERVVSKGAYQIKLSQAAGTLPAHGHEH